VISGNSKYILFTLATSGLLFFFWVGTDSPAPLHLTIQNDEQILALEDTLITHYEKKLDPTWSKSETLPEKIQEVRVLLLDYKQRINELKKGPKNNDQLLKLVASISAPTLEGLKLQASDIKIYDSSSSDNDKKITRVYVAYNMVGPKNMGALQIITLNDEKKKNESSLSLTLNQTVLFKDSEIHGLTIHDNHLYLAGATSNPDFKTPASLEVFELDDGRISNEESFRIDLPSYAGTSVVAAHDFIFVSVGDDRGGIIQLSEEQLHGKGLKALEQLKHTFFDLQDPRDLAYNNHSVYAISGGQANLWVKRMKGNGQFDSPEVIPLNGANLPEAKSTIEVTNNLAYMGLGDGGTKIISLNNYSYLGEIPQKNHPELDSTLTVTNAVGISNDEIFTADGEGGSRVFTMTGSGSLNQVANIKFGPKTSVNSVQKVGDYVVFATGLGGVKIAYLSKKKAKKAK